MFQVVTSAHFLLSDIYVSDNIDDGSASSPETSDDSDTEEDAQEVRTLAIILNVF